MVVDMDSTPYASGTGNTRAHMFSTETSTNRADDIGCNAYGSYYQSNTTVVVVCTMAPKRAAKTKAAAAIIAAVTDLEEEEDEGDDEYLVIDWGKLEYYTGSPKKRFSFQRGIWIEVKWKSKSGETSWSREPWSSQWERAMADAEMARPTPASLP